MKKLLFVALISALVSNSYAQMTYEHSFVDNYVSFVLFSSIGEKIVTNDTTNIYLYNMDYTLWKTITPTHYAGYKLAGISCVSDNLFNSDNLVEAIVSYYGISMHPYYKSQLINETATVILDLDSSDGGYPHYDQDNNSYKVVNTATGKVHAKRTTLKKAEGQIRLLHMMEAHRG